jgi:hypothetical protein
MDGHDVSAVLQRRNRRRRRLNFFVGRDESRILRRQYSVEINFRVFIVMKLDFGVAEVRLVQRELPPEPDIAGVPGRIHDGSGRSFRSETADALIPF